MKRSFLPSLLLAAVFGAAVWALSPSMTGHSEPWDAGGIYYSVALLLGGALSGFVVTKPLWAHYVGAILGQLLYQILALPLGPLIVVGLLFLGVWSLLYMGGAYLGARIRNYLGGRPGAA